MPDPQPSAESETVSVSKRQSTDAETFDYQVTAVHHEPAQTTFFKFEAERVAQRYTRKQRFAPNRPPETARPEVVEDRGFLGGLILRFSHATRLIEGRVTDAPVIDSIPGIVRHYLVQEKGAYGVLGPEQGYSIDHEPPRDQGTATAEVLD